MNDSHEKIQEFWHWFQINRAKFDLLVDTAEPFWDVALDQLKRLNRHLCFELSAPGAGVRELIISAQGHSDVFQLVEALVAGAPSIPGWQFIALKSPMGFDFTSTYEGTCFEPRAMWFLPLQSNLKPAQFGVRVGVPNLTKERASRARLAVAVILDTALGERAAASEIQYLEVFALPDAPESHGYLPLCELPAYIEWRKQQRKLAG